MRRSQAFLANRWALVVVLAAALTSCSRTTTEFSADFQVIEEVTFAGSLGINLADYTKLESSGIYIRDLVVGDGPELVQTSFAEANYRLWLINGNLIQQGRFSWQLNNLEAVLGLEYGALNMKQGGTRRIIVPPALGYGEFGSPGGLVPPGAILIFEVELTEVR